jgi:transposase
MIMIGSLVTDIGGHCISAVSKIFNISRATVRKAVLIFNNKINYKLNIETRGRKRLTEIMPELKQDIKKIIEDNLSIDPRFKSETQYVRLTVKEIKKQLIKTGKYTNGSFSNSSLNNLLNDMGYSLKKVQKTKPLKKIKETNKIFENVHKKKNAAMNNNRTALISVDTKDKVLLGPFCRGGKNRIQIEAVDHELTNNCLIPFGILDIKKNLPYFFNYTSKPTSMDLVDCIEVFYKEQYLNTDINKLAILLDNGPDNSGVRTIFLKGLIDLGKKYNIEIELIFYPPYHSKYNPVERLWARLENMWNGFLLETKGICLNFMQNLTWNNVNSITKICEVKYEKGLKIEKKEMNQLEEKHIFREEGLEKWSIVITPFSMA